MDANPSRSATRPPFGELVLHHDDGNTSIWPIAAPVTLIGSAGDSDICLIDDDIRALHGLITAEPGKLRWRTWQGDGVRINGCPVSSAELHEGDVLEIGPYRLQVHYLGSDLPPAVEQALSAQHVEAELNSAPTPLPGSLRRIAAALVAQHSALSEEEHRLTVERTALEHQEQQLAGHLEERRLHLIALQEQLSEARAGLRRERSEFLNDRKQQDITHDQEAAQARSLRLERDRLGRLRRRLAARFARERTELRQREQQLRSDLSRFTTERAAFQAEQAELRRERAIEKERLHSAWESLSAEQARWRERISAFQTIESGAAERHEARLRELQLATEQFEQQRRRIALEVVRLRAEADGLEARIEHHRSVLRDLENRRNLETPTPKLEVLPMPFALAPMQEPTLTDDLPEPETADAWRQYAFTVKQRAEILERRRVELERLAEETADERAALMEQIRHLLIVQERLRTDQERWLGELSEIAADCARQEEELQARRKALAEREDKVHRLECELNRVRRESAAREASVHTTERLLAGERARLEAARSTELAAAEQRSRELQHLFDRWQKVFANDLAALREELDACIHLRQGWTERLKTLAEEVVHLHEERAKVRKQSLALTELQAELEGTLGTATLEKRLERIYRRITAEQSEAAEQLRHAHQTLAADADSLRRRFEEWGVQVQEIAEERRTLHSAAYHAEREKIERDTLSALAEAERRGRLIQQERYERDLAELREEVERLAAGLLAGEDTVFPTEQAA